MRDMSRDEQEERQASWPGSLLRGFDAVVSNNAQAFGFSITVTVTFGAVSAQHPNPPTRLELLGFAMVAVAAFALLNIVAVLLLEARGKRESERMLLVATATDRPGRRSPAACPPRHTACALCAGEPTVSSSRSG